VIAVFNGDNKWHRSTTVTIIIPNVVHLAIIHRFQKVNAAIAASMNLSGLAWGIHDEQRSA
jgi:hypothetical protein